MVTLDNRRLNMAKRASIDTLPINVYSHDSPPPPHLTPRNLDIWKMRFQISVAFNKSITDSPLKDCFVIKINPLTYGGAAMCRCAIQGTKFPIYGSTSLPVLARSREWPSVVDVVLNQIRNAHAVEDVLRDLAVAEVVVCFIGESKPTIHNLEFQQYLQDLLSRGSNEFFSKFQIVSVDHWLEYGFEPRVANGDRSVDDIQYYKELDEFLCDQEEELLFARDLEHSMSIAKKTEQLVCAAAASTR